MSNENVNEESLEMFQEPETLSQNDDVVDILSDVLNDFEKEYMHVVEYVAMCYGMMPLRDHHKTSNDTCFCYPSNVDTSRKKCLFCGQKKDCSLWFHRANPEFLKCASGHSLRIPNEICERKCFSFATTLEDYNGSQFVNPRFNTLYRDVANTFYTSKMIDMRFLTVCERLPTMIFLLVLNVAVKKEQIVDMLKYLSNKRFHSLMTYIDVCQHMNEGFDTMKCIFPLSRNDREMCSEINKINENQIVNLVTDSIANVSSGNTNMYDSPKTNISNGLDVFMNICDMNTFTQLTRLEREQIRHDVVFKFIKNVCDEYGLFRDQLYHIVDNNQTRSTFDDLYRRLFASVEYNLIFSKSPDTLLKFNNFVRRIEEEPLSFVSTLHFDRRWKYRNALIDCHGKNVQVVDNPTIAQKIIPNRSFRLLYPSTSFNVEIRFKRAVETIITNSEAISEFYTLLRHVLIEREVNAFVTYRVDLNHLFNLKEINNEPVGVHQLICFVLCKLNDNRLNLREDTDIFGPLQEMAFVFHVAANSETTCYNEKNKLSTKEVTTILKEEAGLIVSFLLDGRLC